MIRNKTVLTFSSFSSMFFLGVGVTIVGASARNIGLTPYQIGLLMSIQQIGFALSVTVSGTLSDSYEKTRILCLGSLVLAASFLTFYLDESFALNFFIMFFIGAGIGTYEGVTDAMLLDIHKEKQSLYINANHFAVTFGCILVTLYLLFLQMNWRHAVIQSGIAVFLLAIVFAITSVKNPTRSETKVSERLRFLVRQRLLFMLFLATICAIGLELGSIAIMTTYLMNLRDFSQVTSKLGLVVFLSGIAIGRLFAGFFTKEDKVLRYVLILFFLSAVFTGTVYLADITLSVRVLGQAITYGAIFISGATVSALLPLIITLTGLAYKNMSGTALGVIKIAIPVGGIFVPFALSMITKYSSFKSSLVLFPGIALAGFVLMFSERNRLTRAISLE